MGKPVNISSLEQQQSKGLDTSLGVSLVGNKARSYTEAKTNWPVKSFNKVEYNLQVASLSLLPHQRENLGQQQQSHPYLGKAVHCAPSHMVHKQWFHTFTQSCTFAMVWMDSLDTTKSLLVNWQQTSFSIPSVNIWLQEGTEFTASGTAEHTASVVAADAMTLWWYDHCIYGAKEMGSIIYDFSLMTDNLKLFLQFDLTLRNWDPYTVYGQSSSYAHSPREDTLCLTYSKSNHAT